MTDIASNLDKVIEKLDGMTSEVVAKNYGMDIASKVDHIAKQLDYVQAGGGSGGSGGSDIAIVHMTGGPGTITSCDKTFDEITQLLNDGKVLFAIEDSGNNINKNYYYYDATMVNTHQFTQISGYKPYGSNIVNVTINCIDIDNNNVITKYTWMSNN